MAKYYLNKKDLGVIFEALRYAKKNINECTLYPSYEFKMEQLKEVQNVIDKLKGKIK